MFLLQVSEVRVSWHAYTNALCTLTYETQLSKFTYQSIKHPSMSPVSRVTHFNMALSTRTHPTQSLYVLIIAVISSWTKTKFDKSTNGWCDFVKFPFLHSLFLPFIHHILIISPPNVFSEIYNFMSQDRETTQ